MDKAINPNVSDMSVIESMKAIMTLTLAHSILMKTN